VRQNEINIKTSKLFINMFFFHAPIDKFFFRQKNHLGIFIWSKNSRQQIFLNVKRLVQGSSYTFKQ
jgi:hypothetical protein